MHNYCTLFDSNYLTRGLAMYESLKTHSGSFHLYIFAFDDRSYSLLKKLQLDHVTVISLQEFEDEQLLAIKETRSVAEYCWTCTPSIIKYSIEHYSLEACTYLDADLYFFDDPSILIEEMGEKSVLITEHRYTPKYDQSATSGIYCVQFMTFKNNRQGMEVLNWWRNACISWCYAKYEDGKFGDQKYLDDWTTRFETVHVLEHLGGGVAPWNIQQYNLLDPDFKLIFYHFHYVKFLNEKKIDLGNFQLNKQNLKILYIPYLKKLDEISQKLPDIGFNYNSPYKQNFTWKTPFKIVKRLLNNSYNIYSKQKLLGM